MFPTAWYAPAYFTRTYWPRPGQLVKDAVLTDFVLVAGVDRTLRVPATMFEAVAAGDRWIPVAGPDVIAVADPGRWLPA